MPAPRARTAEKRFSGRNQYIGPLRFDGTRQRTAFSFEHAVQVSLDEALAGPDRGRITDANH